MWGDTACSLSRATVPGSRSERRLGSDTHGNYKLRNLLRTSEPCAGIMTDDYDDFEDSVADAILGDSTYDRLRVERSVAMSHTIAQKLRWQSGLLLALAATFPILVFAPLDVQGFFPSGDPTGAITKALVIGLVGGLATLGGGLGLVYVSIRCRAVGNEMSERRAHSLLALEDMSTYLGLVTGGFAIGVCLLLHLLALGGASATAAYVESVGQNPFAGVGTDVPGTVVSGLGALGSVVLLLASRHLARGE